MSTYPENAQQIREALEGYGPIAHSHALLISAGCRPFAEVGAIIDKPGAREEVGALMGAVVRESRIDPRTCIPWYHVDKYGTASFGYAQAQWAIHRHEWVMDTEIPTPQRHRILGLLFGYSPSAIQAHDDLHCGGL